MVQVGTYCVCCKKIGNIKRFTCIFFSLWLITNQRNIYISISTRYGTMFISRIVGGRVGEGEQ